MPHNIYIDCGGGFRQEAAVRMAFGEPGVKIAALASVFGETSAGRGYRELKELAAALDPKIRVGMGAKGPLMRQPDCLKLSFEGAYTAGDSKTSGEEPVFEETGDGYAWDILYEEALKCGGDLTVITLGALTNLAVALFKYEDLPRHLSRIVMLGGSAGAGDVLPFGEANVVRDPHACAAVLASGIPVTMVGLEVTEPLGSDKDAAAVAAALVPGAAVSQRRTVEVETVPGKMYGRTIVDQRVHLEPSGCVEVVERLDREACLGRWERAQKSGKGETER